METPSRRTNAERMSDWLRLPAASAGPVLLARWRVFFIIALIMLLGLPVAGLTLWFDQRPGSSAIAFGAMTVVILAIQLARRGKLDLARTVLAALYVTLLGAGMVLGDGLHDVTTTLLSPSMVVASLLLSRRGYVVAASAAVAMVIAIGWAEIAGWLVCDYCAMTNWNRVFFIASTLILTVIPIRALNESLERALAAVHRRNLDLDERNAELAAQKAAIGRVEERATKIFQAAPDPMMICRLGDSRIVEVNDAWVRGFGYSRAEMLDGSLDATQLWQEPSDLTRVFEQLAHGHHVRRFETNLRKKSREVARVSLSAERLELDGVAHAVMPVTEITALKLAEKRIRYLATRDPLTGLPNRLLLLDRLARAIAQASRETRPLALLFIDLDRFKTINDSLGHTLGDAFLRAVAHRIGALMRSGDTLARFGGDEFVALLDGIGNSQDAAVAAQRILDAMQQPFQIEGHLLSRGVSVGISVYPADGDDPATLIRNADTAMYNAKEAGRGVWRFFASEMNARVKHRLWLENGMREALALGQFELLYQPKVEIRSGKIAGLEALLRWRHPELGLIAPGQFMDVAEETGLIVPIGRWVFQQVCEQIASWQRLGVVHPVAVNLSVRQFNARLQDDIAEALSSTGVNPQQIELEITESLFMQDPVMVGAILQALSQGGTRVALDDFGTGFSSLTSLKQFFVHTLKIDRSFIHDIETDPQDVAIVRAVIAMARSIGVRVVAEGVEGEAQLTILRELECDEYQGFLFAHPMTPAEVAQRFGAGAALVA